MFNERNKRIDDAHLLPRVITGLNGAPQAGEKFKVFADEAEPKKPPTGRSVAREQGIRTKKHITLMK